MCDTERYDTQAVKDRLNAYREADQDISNQTELLERLISRMEGLGAKEITDMPRSPSPSVDRISGLMNQKIEIEQCIAEDVTALEAQGLSEAVLRHPLRPCRPERAQDGLSQACHP